MAEPVEAPLGDGVAGVVGLGLVGASVGELVDTVVGGEAVGEPPHPARATARPTITTSLRTRRA